MSVPLSDYAIIGDTHTTALVRRDGSIDWLCWPRHDSPALFLRLLDEERGGACTLELAGAPPSSRRYVPDTNVLETGFEGPDGAVTLTDFMPVHPPGTTPEEGPDGDAQSRVIRILHCTRGTVEGRFTVRPTFDYARLSCTPTVQPDGSVLFDAGDANRVRVTGAGIAAVAGETAVIPVRLREGERLHLVLTQGPDDAVEPVETLEDACARLEDTTSYWQRWAGRCTYSGPHEDAVRRSALFLKLMTYSPTGAIIAAPTTALPEAVPGNRNFDYRYAWLRDASFTVTAFLNLGYRREAEEYLRFLRDVDASRGRELALMYGVDGPVPPEEALGHLAGWQGIGPVLIGNAASVQTQHDIYGELLLAISDYLEVVGAELPDRIREGLPELVRNLAARAMAAIDEPDQGIWEVRGEPQHFLHSKALVWVALDRAVRVARRLGGPPGSPPGSPPGTPLRGFDPGELARWEEAAARVRADYLRLCWNEERGSYVRSYGSTELDSSVLRAALFDALPLDDGRLTRTLEVVQRELGAGDLIYRYRWEDGLGGTEGTFAACAFWFASCLAMLGRVDEARGRIDRLLTHANDVGLFAEEIDADTGEGRGNFPQGFTHMAVINHLVRLQRIGRAQREAAAE